MNTSTPCPVCGYFGITYVHGHGQCLQCGTNIEPCCEGSHTLEIRLEDKKEVIKKKSYV